MPTLSEDKFLGERESLPPVLPCSPWKSIGCRIRVPERVQNPPMSAGPEVRSPPVIDPLLLGPTQQCGNETKRATSSGRASKMNIQASGSRPETGHNVAPKDIRPPIRPHKPSMPALSNRYSDYSLKYMALKRAARNQSVNEDGHGCATSRPRASNRITHGLRHSNKASRSDCSHSEEENEEEADEEEDEGKSLDGEVYGETPSSDFTVVISDHEYDGDDDSSDCSESDDEGDNDKDDEPVRIGDPRGSVTQKTATATLASFSSQIHTHSSSQKLTTARHLVVKDAGKDAKDPAVGQATPAASAAQVNRGQGLSMLDHVLTPERTRINQAQTSPITDAAAHLSIRQIKTTPSIFDTSATTDLKRKRAVGEEDGEENDELRVRRRSHREA